MLGQMLNLNTRSLIEEAIQTRHNTAEGVLIINILSVTLQPYLPTNKDVILEVCIGEQSKSSLVRETESHLNNYIGNTYNSARPGVGEEIILNKIFHFQSRVPHTSIHSDNIISIKLVSHGNVIKQDTKQGNTCTQVDENTNEQSQNQSVLACEYFHLYDIIRDTPIQGTIDLKSAINSSSGLASQQLTDIVMAQASLHIAFTYGLYGFSQTFHLEDFPSAAGYTLFPRAHSSDDARYNTTSHVINAKLTKPIKLIPESSISSPGNEGSNVATPDYNSSNNNDNNNNNNNTCLDNSSNNDQPEIQLTALTASLMNDVITLHSKLEKCSSKQERIAMMKSWI